MTQTDLGENKAGATPIKAAGWYRWVVCALLFAATGLLYVDRQTIGFLKSTLSTTYGWDDSDYALIVRSFMITYAIGFVLFGRIIDVLGAKRGYTLAVVIWTAAHLACAVLGFLPPEFMLISFMLTQAALGLGQGGNFPAALKAVAEWFPQRERALAIGIFNAGSNMGAIITPLLVPLVLALFGWQWAFVATGALSVFWLICWVPLYAKPAESKHVSKDELAYIESDPFVPVKQLPWLKVLTKKETWAYGMGKMLTDPVWFFYLFWLPDFFTKTYSVEKLSGVALPIIAIYLISDVGSVFGGWMSSAMINAGLTVNRARKLSMLICALCVLPVAFATMMFHDLWTVTVVIGIAAAAHQAFSANLMATVGDMMPKQAVGSCSGLGGTAGAIGGIIMTFGVGAALKGLGGYTAVFFVAGLIYLIAVLVVHMLSPRLEQAKFGD